MISTSSRHADQMRILKMRVGMKRSVSLQYLKPCPGTFGVHRHGVDPCGSRHARNKVSGELSAGQFGGGHYIPDWDLRILGLFAFGTWNDLHLQLHNLCGFHHRTQRWGHNALCTET
ncbi:hypothetical protein TNIN_138091, partial [Trichonephila inaurata madagascariensis]